MAQEPVVLGASFQSTGSYTTTLVTCAAGLVLASGLVLRLGPYRFAGRETDRVSATRH